MSQLNDRMNNATEGQNSLAQQAVTLQLAQADLVNADANLQLAQTGLEQARTEAGRQVRYLTVAVRPIQVKNQAIHVSSRTPFWRS